MANRYIITVTNLEGIVSTCTIVQPGDPSPTTVNVRGNFKILSDPVGSPRETIRSISAEIYLEANVGLPFTDLFTEQPRQWQVVIERDAVVRFVGWLENDTVIEDWVNSEWITRFTANDGLRDLQNIGYADPSGNNYIGFETLRTHLLRALNKIGLDIPVRFISRSDIDSRFPVQLRLDELDPSVTEDYFDGQLNCDAFLQSDAVTPEPCIRVVRDILFPANAMIIQHEGVFTICWQLSIPSTTLNGILNAQLYASDGTLIGPEQLDINQIIGSQINGFAIHHAQENQRLQRRPSLGTAKNEYTFGEISSILLNSDFANDGATIDFWTINQPAAAQLVPGPDNEILFRTGTEASPAVTSDISGATILEGQKLIWRCIVEPTRTSASRFLVFRQRVQIQLDGGPGNNYYLDANNEWVTAARRIPLTAFVNVAPTVIEFGFDSVPVPAEGNLIVRIYPVDDNSGSSQFTQEAIWHRVQFAGINEQNEALKSIVRAQRLANPSPVTFEADPVRISDSTGIIYDTTLWQNDLSQPAVFGYSRPINPIDESMLLSTTAADQLLLQHKIARYFTGAVYGFLPYFSRVEIDGIGENFMVTGWAWDAGTDLIELELWEVFYLVNTILDPPPFFLDYEIVTTATQRDRPIKSVIRG